jgi:hypothetical protein
VRQALKNDPSYEFIGEVILKINIVQAEKIKAEVYVNQDKSLSDLQTLIKHSFLLYFPRELLMNFLNTFIIPNHAGTKMKNATLGPWQESNLRPCDSGA